MSVWNNVTEKLILPLSDRWLGNSVGRYLKFLLHSQKWSRSELDNYQNLLLLRLLTHSFSTVPYYNNLFESIGIKPSDIKTKSDLIKIPITTKAAIKKNGQDCFTSNSYPRVKTLPASSSGSTGEPLFYRISKEAYSMNIAASLRGWYWMGYRLGDKYVKLSQNVRSSWVKRLQDIINRNLYLVSDPLDDDNFLKILASIEKYKPKIIRGYPDPLLFIAQFKKQHPEYGFIPLAIATTGNTLASETRKQIEDSFNCKIFDAYNCEGNSVVFECPSHTCYHSTEEYGISEVLNENNEPITKGVGRLISTDLHNLAHPFIRYDTQDMVELDGSDCICGRKHIKILRIIGRDNDIIVARNGRKFIVHSFTGFFQIDSSELNRSIDQFQIIKMKDGTIRLRLIVNNNYNNSVENHIRSYWDRQFDQPIQIELVDKIPLTASGKRRFIINE
ncbi:MAG: phenylacetate--CoA ligase family protein [Bacteroidales bacterium]|nr:phenylacetate--CoA ligase family protein [Bacteroidales bacterium]